MTAVPGGGYSLVYEELFLHSQGEGWRVQGEGQLLDKKNITFSFYLFLYITSVYCKASVERV